jgi:glutamyl-tRNA reductase
MIDLAVPRDIEPEVGSLSDIFLYTVDDLQDIVAKNIASRREAAEEAGKLIDLQVVRFMRWLQSLDSVPTIRAFRDKIDNIQQTELTQARRRIANGADPDQVLEELARNLSRKFAHAPSEALKQANENANGALAQATRRLFKLPG